MGNRGGSAVLGFPQVEQLPSWGMGKKLLMPEACRPVAWGDYPSTDTWGWDGVSRRFR
jgi:hypothetical protein